MDHICFDRYLPADLQRGIPHDHNHPQHAAFWVSKLWPSGTTLKVAFLSGTAAQQQFAKDAAAEWSKYANIKFAFGPVVGSQIRISFNPNDGAWSYIGKDCLNIPANQATMNLGWTDGGVALHELGHTLGLIHEHQSPNVTIQWNKPVVNAALSGSPNFWDQATIDSNMYAKYDGSQFNASTYDSHSIMQYSMPASWFVNGVDIPENVVLSALDKQYAAKVYPGAGAPPPPSTATVIPIQLALRNGVDAKIGTPGDEDTFTFAPTVAGSYTVETLGTTDVVMTVLSKAGVILGLDDDSGAGSNASLTLKLDPDTYTVKIRHYSKTGTGDYSVRVVKG